MPLLVAAAGRQAGRILDVEGRLAIVGIVFGPELAIVNEGEEKAPTLLEDCAELVRRTPVGADVDRADAVLGNSKVHECVDALSDTPRILLSDHKGVTKRRRLGVCVFREGGEEVDHVILCDLLADGLVRRQLLFHQSAPFSQEAL